MASDPDAISLAPGWWTRRITRAARRFRRGEIDTTLLLVAFGGDVALFAEVMHRVAAGIADPAAFVPFRSHTPARRT